MEFFYLIKATQKSGKPDAAIWFTAKTEARANLQLDVALEDAEIETGRGKDYARPVRTDFPVYDDLPDEGTVDFTWCERYTLADDQRTWNVIPGAADQGETTLDPVTNINEELPAAPVTSTDITGTGITSLLENRTPGVRFAVHLLGDKYLSEISQEQQIVANELASDEGNTYFQNLLQAKNDVADIGDLSLHAEWKLVQAVKEVFPQSKEHEPALMATFMSSWIEADAGDRNQLVEDWKNGKLPAKTEMPEVRFENGLRIEKNDDENTRYPVCKLPFRKQLLSQLTADELRHHITRADHAEIAALEMDTDNSYVQNLLLAAENCEEIKGYDTKDLWRYTNAIRKVFSQDKRHELALVLRFTRIWAATDYIDRGILAREWAAGNRISSVQRTDAGTNADGGYVTDRGEGAHHTLDALDLEIACALLPMDFNHLEIPGSIYRRAKEIVAKKEEPWKSWSALLRNQPGILSVNRAAIFNLVRIAPENIHLTPAAHLEFINQTMTTEFNAATELLPLPAARPQEEIELPVAQPSVENLGGGMFSIDGLMGGNSNRVINAPSNEVEKTETVAENTSDVQMEKAHNHEVQNSVEIPESQKTAGTTEGGDETGVCTDAINIDTVHHNIAGKQNRLYTHLMLDLETMGKKPGAPVVSIGAVFFDPATGETGGEFYQAVSLESCMYFGAKPDAGTILWWLKQSSEARSAIVVDDAVGLVESLELLTNFIAENAANGSRNVQLWGNGSSFDCSIIEAAFELADMPFPVPHWNYRDVRTVVELGKAVGMNPRYEIPFEGDQHHALADARHQVKYVSAIWQRLTAN